MDSENDILESDETDNSYCHTYTWVGAPDPPALTSPANGAGCQNTSILLDWEASDHAETYRLQVDNNSDFSSPVFNQGGLISTQWTVGGLSASTTYYWRVRATNPAGNGSYASARSFTTAPASAPSAPTLDGPSNGATCQSTTLDLDWNPSSGASIVS